MTSDMAMFCACKCAVSRRELYVCALKYSLRFKQNENSKHLYANIHCLQNWYAYHLST